MKGTCFNVQRYAIHDGPGIRTTVFLKGCPLSCTWCHNPEGISSEPEILVVADRCMTCGACVKVCPSPPPIGLRGDRENDRLQCTRCGSCVDVCATGARRWVGRSTTVEELIREVERDAPFYEESGGGVTFSGGEPLLQGEFLLACLRECRDRGLHTTVDTCGYAEASLLLEVARLSNLILFDLKILDDAIHRDRVGAPLGPILENLRALDEAGSAVWIRFPLIPEVTDTPENLEALGDQVASLRNTDVVHVLPAHKTASDKYARLGRLWDHQGMEPASRREVERAAETLGRFGLNVMIGG